MAEQGWAVILGASSGFGEATGLERARSGYNIIGVHLDRKGTQTHVDEVIEGIRAAGRRALFFNVNAADPERRIEVLSRASEEIGPAGAVSVLLHSLAFGNLRPYIAETPQDAITQAQMDMTLGVMAHSLVYWVQDLVHRGLMRKGGKIFAMTSAGGTRVLPNYGAVSAAKAALEAHVRQLAMELAPRGIAVTALKRNPSTRLTTPQDVARAIAGLCAAGTEWITGNVIGVDGGEDIIG